MTEPRLSRIADADEPSYVRLALTLFALEIAAILRATRGPLGVRDVLNVVRSAYLSPFGIFRRRWAERFGALMRGTAATVAKTSALPRALVTELELRADELGRVVTQTSAARLATVDPTEPLTRAVVAQAIQPRARSQLIGATEAFGTANLTEWHLALQSGAQEKRWRTMMDELVRESHVKCGNEGFIPIGNRFSNGLTHPHEQGAPIAETANCRCVLIVR